MFQVIGIIVLVVVVIYLIYLFIKFVVLPALLIVSLIGILIGGGNAVYNYAVAFRNNVGFE